MRAFDQHRLALVEGFFRIIFCISSFCYVTNYHMLEFWKDEPKVLRANVFTFLDSRNFIHFLRRGILVEKVSVQAGAIYSDSTLKLPILLLDFANFCQQRMQSGYFVQYTVIRYFAKDLDFSYNFSSNCAEKH